MYEWLNNAEKAETLEQYEKDTGAKLTEADKEMVLRGFHNLKEMAEGGEDIKPIVEKLLEKIA